MLNSGTAPFWRSASTSNGWNRCGALVCIVHLMYAYVILTGGVHRSSGEFIPELINRLEAHRGYRGRIGSGFNTGGVTLREAVAKLGPWVLPGSPACSSRLLLQSGSATSVRIPLRGGCISESWKPRRSNDRPWVQPIKSGVSRYLQCIFFLSLVLGVRGVSAVLRKQYGTFGLPSSWGPIRAKAHLGGVR